MFENGFPRGWSSFRKLALLFRSVLNAAVSVLKTVTGNPIHITDALAQPAVDLQVDFSPVQSGSGDPSPDNVRPISGLTGLTIYRSGADTSDPTVYLISWQTEAGTIYDGTLDVTTGVLTATMAEVDAGDASWIRYDTESAYAFYISITFGRVGVAREAPDFLASNYKAVDTTSRSAFVNNGAELTACHVTGGRGFYVKDSRYTDAAAFKASMTGQKIVYVLAEPQTFQLSPTEVMLLQGENNLWSDANGDLSLTYYADGRASDAEALGILLGNRYVNNHEDDEPKDREALEILLGGNDR